MELVPNGQKWMENVAAFLAVSITVTQIFITIAPYVAGRIATGVVPSEFRVA
jgi:hypothetical protein